MAPPNSNPAAVNVLDPASGGAAEPAALDFLRSVLQSATERAIIAADLDGLILLWNEGARRLYGYEAAEVVGRVSWELLHAPEDVAAGKPHAVMRDALDNGRWEGVIARVRKDGRRFLARAVLTPRRDAAGRHVGYILISKDVTQEVPGGRGDDRFQGLLESAPDAMLIINPEGHIVVVNSQTERVFGYAREELLGQPVEILIPRRFRAGHPAQRDDYFAQPRVRPMGAGRELYGLRKGGAEFPVEVSLSPLQAEGRTYVISAVRDVTQRQRVERALQEKNVELANANLAKDRFLAGMSHELRTPLNAILGFTGTLLMKLPGPLTADQEMQLRTVQASGRHLLSLINDLLDLAKIESGKVELRLEPVACGDVVQEVAGALRLAAEAKGLEFAAEIMPPDLAVRADRRALSQILLNLVGNAVKFTERGAVRIQVRRRNDGGRALIEFRVADTGAGIRAEEQVELFRPFAQVGIPGRLSQHGTGLGLHLSRKLAELLGGTITLDSEFGKGSTFTLVLSEA